MARLEPHDVLFFATPAELREWLDANHASAAEQWVGQYRKASGRPSITWEELVDEVLCVGWIDGIRVTYGDGIAQRITPRRPGSTWSARNVGRVEALQAEGRMRPAGQAAFERRRADRTAIYSFERQTTLDEHGIAALRARAGAWAFWEAQPPGYRRTAAHWIASARREETRARRLSALVDACAAGERLGELTGRPRTPDAGRSSIG